MIEAERCKRNVDFEILWDYGQEIGEHVEAPAVLRIEVLRGFPYFCDGGTDNERCYLRTCIESTKGLAVVVPANDEVAGAGTPRDLPATVNSRSRLDKLPLRQSDT